MARSKKTVAELIAIADGQYQNKVEYDVKNRAVKTCLEENYEYMFRMGKYRIDVEAGVNEYVLPADCAYEDIIAIYVDEKLYLGKDIADRRQRNYVFEEYVEPLAPDREYIKLTPDQTEDITDGIVLYYKKMPFFLAWGLDPDGQQFHKDLAINGYVGDILNELAKDGDFEVDAGAGIAVGFVASSLVDVTYSVSDEFAYTGEYSQKAVLNDYLKFLTYDIEFYDNEATVVAAIAKSGIVNSCKLDSGPDGVSNQRVDVAEFIYVNRDVGDVSKTGLEVYFSNFSGGVYPGPVTSYVDSLVVVNLSRDFGYEKDDRPTNSDFVYYLQGYIGIKSEAEKAVIDYIKYEIAKTGKDIEMANGFYSDYEEQIEKIWMKSAREMQKFMEADSIDRERRWR